MGHAGSDFEPKNKSCEQKLRLSWESSPGFESHMLQKQAAAGQELATQDRKEQMQSSAANIASPIVLGMNSSCTV